MTPARQRAIAIFCGIATAWILAFCTGCHPLVTPHQPSSRIVADGVYVAPLSTFVRLPVPPKADSLWAFDVQCSGHRPDRKYGLNDVLWFMDSLNMRDRFKQLAGVWIPPDTILLDVNYTTDQRVIAHELMHHLLHLSLRVKNVHPDKPFKTCGLMAP